MKIRVDGSLLCVLPLLSPYVRLSGKALEHVACAMFAHLVLLKLITSPKSHAYTSCSHVTLTIVCSRDKTQTVLRGLRRGKASTGKRNVLDR